MSSTSGNIKDFAFSEHTKAFNTLISVFDAFSIRYFLIGAQARDVHFFQKNIRPARATRDIDFAIMIETMGQYEELVKELISKDFEKTKHPYRLIWPGDNTIIDLLPFGPIEKDHTVVFREDGTELTVLGFSEIIEETTPLTLNEKSTFSVPVPPLHGLFLLKLLSWDEKRSDRDKDLQDLIQIVDNYWEFVEDEAYEKQPDLFEEEDFDIKKAAARILGRHLRRTLDRSDKLSEIILQILEEQIMQIVPPAPMVMKYSSEVKISLEKARSILEEILKGIKE